MTKYKHIIIGVVIVGVAAFLGFAKVFTGAAGNKVTAVDKLMGK